MTVMLTGTRVALVIAKGVEAETLATLRERLEAVSAEVELLAPEAGAVATWKDEDWTGPAEADGALAEATPAAFEAIVVPDGVLSCEALLACTPCLDFLREARRQGVLIATIGRSAALLSEIGEVAERKVTGHAGLRRDLEHGGATWVDEPLVKDEAILTASGGAALPALCDALIAYLVERQPFLASS